MYYHLQYGLLDIKDDHIPDNGIGAFLTDLNEVKQYIQREWSKYNARTQHYKRLYQIVEVLEVLPDDHIAEYKKMAIIYLVDKNLKVNIWLKKV